MIHECVMSTWGQKRLLTVWERLPLYCYEKTVPDRPVTVDDRLRAEIIERIMCDFGVDLDPICARHGLSASTMLKSSSRLQDLISNGIVELDGTSLAVAHDSRFLVRSVAAAFDAHLDGSKQLHSRAV